jgi:D-alanine transaminase
MTDIGYLNNQFMPLAEVKISPDDRGFQFGDGVYEVVMVYHGIPCLLQDHLSRLEHSARGIRLTLPYTPSDWEQRILEGVQRSGYQNCKVYIQVTRGVVPRDHLFPNQCSPTVFMSFRKMTPLDEKLRHQGVKVMTVPDLRWGRCDIKSLNLLPNVLAKQQAKESGAFEAIFIRDGEVTEGTSCNVMIVREGVIHTPESNHHILAGVTRKILLDLAKKQGLSVCERTVKARELFEVDEMFLVGTTIEVMPVIAVDETPVGSGHSGPIAKRLSACYHDFLSGLV